MNRNKKPLSFSQKLLKYTKKEKKNTTKQVLIVCPLLLISITVLSVYESRPMPEVQAKQDQLVNGVLVGDVMLAGHVQTQWENEAGIFEHVIPYFDQAQYVTGNFERPVTNSADSAHFTTNSDVLEKVSDVGFSVMNLANSHLMDFEEDGLHETLDAFSKHDVDSIGAGTSIEDESNNVSYTDINGTTIATLGFSDDYEEGAGVDETSGGITTFSPEVFIPMVSEANRQADVVIVHAHWGRDFDNTPSERQQSLAHTLSDAGADIIVGHGPQVLQEIEVHNDTAIFYSLGNFISDQGWTRTRESALAQFEITEEGSIEYEVVPLTIKEATPAPLNWSDKLNELSITRQLTKNDNLDWSSEEGSIHFSTSIQ